MVKDYYLILGVPVDAAPDAIRSAFRRLARRYHPDRQGRSTGAGAFRDVSEAYSVLSDPERRARYDRELRRPAARAPGPEPLIAEPLSVIGEPESVRPSLEALLDRLSRNLLGAAVPKAEHAEALDFELILSPEEAGRGVRIPFRVPVLSACFRCSGTGLDWGFPCPDCAGEGSIAGRDTVEVDVPPGVRDGAVIEVSLRALAIRNLWLRIHVRVEAH